MTSKKTILCILICVLVAGLFSSCAIDKKCPAYTQTSVEQTNISV